MSRTTHRLGQETCNGCCLTTKPFSGTNGEEVDTRVNIVTYKTLSSCCFQIFNLELYLPGTSTPLPPPTFVTNPLVPNASMFPPGIPGINGIGLNGGVIFSFTSFQVTNLYTSITTEYIPSGLYQVSIGQPGVNPTLPNVIGSDEPMTTLALAINIFGSFDKVLTNLFQQFGVKGFQSLTNPNEFELGKTNITQILWPSFLSWSLTWINFDNVQYTLTASNDLSNGPYGTFTCTTTTLDLNPPPVTMPPTVFQPVTVTQLCSSAWDVPCSPTGYVSARHSFDFNFPCIIGSPGCTGNVACTGATGLGVFCIDEFIIDTRSINFVKDCVCAQFEDDTLIDRPNNQGKLVNALNILFKITKSIGWKAIHDIEYGYIRIIHPDNVLTFSIKLNKSFYNSAGQILPLCMETMSFKQGAKTDKTKIGSDFLTRTTSNGACLLKGLCWVMESDKNGYFLIA